MARNLFQQLYYKDLHKVYSKFEGVILDNVIGDIPDIQTYFEDLGKNVLPESKILISYHNPSWEPILTLASRLGLRKRVGVQNWLDEEDIRNILDLSGFEVISTTKRFFGITQITITRPVIPQPANKNQYSVSVIIPARNEEGNIPKIVPSIPKFGKWQEFIFVEGHSTDATWDKIKDEEKKRKKTRVFKQKGEGKADAVWLGLRKAKGDILMIYDADRTVNAKDLVKFYDVLALGLGEFANGNRLLYPMEGDAMQSINRVGNQIFSLVFTKILGQRFKDTLCGTKVFWRKDFQKFRKSDTDPFGDFDLIFSAIRRNLKVVEIPVKYKERVYGSTNINRYYHGLLLIKMIVIAFFEFKI